MMKYARVLLKSRGWICRTSENAYIDLFIKKPPHNLPICFFIERELARLAPLIFVAKLQELAERWNTIVVVVTDFRLDAEAVTQCNSRRVYPIHYRDLGNLDRLVPSRAMPSPASVARNIGQEIPEQTDSLTLALDSARTATDRKDWQAALSEWERVKQATPDGIAGYIGTGHALRELGRLSEAEATFAEASQRFPADRWAGYHHAHIATLRQDRDEAVRRWDGVRERFPDFVHGYLAGAQALLRQGRTEEADALIAQAATRFPANPWAAHSYASMATRRRNWDEALRAWATVRERFPDFVHGIIGTADALRAAGRDAEADEMLRRGMERFPADTGIAFRHAELAAHSGDWAEALSRWQQVREKFPSAKEVDAAIRQASARLEAQAET